MAKKKPEITQKTWQQAYRQYEYERLNNLYNTLVTAKGQDEYKKKRRQEQEKTEAHPLFNIGQGIGSGIRGESAAVGTAGARALGKAIGEGAAEAQKKNWIGNAFKNAGNAVLEQLGKTEGGKIANAILGGFNLYQYKKEQEMLGYDLEAGKKELDELHAQLIQLDEAYAAKNKDGAYASDPFANDQQYQTDRAYLLSKITDQEKYLQDAEAMQKAVQEQDEWLAYMDDPEFEKYAAEGELMDGFDIKTMSGNILLTDTANGGYAAAQMTGDEKKLYYYLLAKHGNELAMDYLKYMNPIVNQREGQKQGQAFTDFLNTDITGSPIFEAPIKSVAFLGHGLYSGLDQWYSGVQQIFKDEAMAPSVQQFAAQTVKENVGTVGGWIYDAAQTTGNMAPSILASTLLGPAGFYTTFGASAYGNAYGEALRMGYDKGQAMAYGALVAASEVTLQKILGGIPGMTGSKAKSLVEKLGAIENKLLRVTAQSGALALSEITEEEMQLFLEPAFRTIINGEDYDAPEIDEIIDTAIVTMLSTGAMNAPSSINSYQTGRDMATGYTQDEQKVIDYLVDKEMGNKELSNQEIKEIEERVKKQISRGEVSLDTIEEVLGGETYQEYQKAAEKEDAAWNEISQLYEGDELVEQRRKFFESSKLLEMKQKLGQEVAQKVGNGFLAESYNQVAQRGKQFTADTSGYSEAERDTIQRAIDSGVLNNTRKTHDFVDLVAKLSAQKGIQFDFTNNKKLADTGFALEGKTVNGFVEGDTVTLNMNSAKYLNTVVGHEITHVLEGTELYDDFQKLMFDYAKSKKATDSKYENEYKERMVTTHNLYKDLEEYQGEQGWAKVKKEVLADMVGDYLFTDSDFVKHLSSNKGLVRKFYDEIRYMVKLAKADTAEAKELAKLEKAFQDMYKQDSVVVDGKKLSMTDSKGKELSKGQQEYFADSKARNNNGQLVSLYHGTENGGFTVFDPSFSDDGISIFLTDNPYLAATYSGSVDPVQISKGLPKFLRWMEGDATKGKGQVGLYNVYANMTNPLVVDAHGDNWNNLSSKNLDSVRFDVVVDQESDIDWDNVKIRLITTVNGKSNTETFWSVDSLREAVASQYNNSVATNVALSAMNSNSSSVKSNVIKWNAETREEGWAETTREIARKAKEQGHDGVIIKNVFDSGKYGTHSSEEKGNVYVVFNSNQVKDVNNKKPTENKDIRYSLSSENEVQKDYGDYRVKGEELSYNGIAPWLQNWIDEANGVAEVAAVETAPVAEDIAPVGEDVAQATYEATPTKDVPEGQQALWEDPVTEKITRSALHERIVDDTKAKFAENGLDYDTVLKNAKDLSTFSTVDNTPQRVMEKALGYKAGQILADITVNKVAQNETEGIKWLNSFTDRKNGLLVKISKQYHIKPGSKESAAAQMYAEGFYVNGNNEIIQYGDAELAQDFPDAKVQENIKGLARDPRIRQIYDETLDMINASRKRNAYPEIQKLDNYFLHFRAMDDTFSKLGLPFNPNDIRAKDLPTDLNGVTADLKPGQPYFASAMHREGKRTSFDLLGGLERYLTSAKNQIYHIDDIQTLRALRNHIAETYGQAHGLENLDLLDEEEAEQRIKDVYDSHLSTFAKFLNEEANVLAGKTALIDRGLEGIIGRRGLTFIKTVNQQTGANMVGYNISSSLTNLLSAVQGFAKTNKRDFVKGFAQFSANKIRSIFGKKDGFAENSSVMVRRKGADRFHRTLWQKLSDPGYAFMAAVDSVSTEVIARAKYNELTRKGMDAKQADIETDKWVSRLMGDRSLGQMPQLYNSAALGVVTKFQLEVRNQLDSQFYDTIKEASASTEDIQNGLARNAKKAAKITSTFFQLAVAQHLFGKAFEYDHR